jgi:hypothetical protein
MVNVDVGPKGNQLKGLETHWGNYLPESGYMAGMVKESSKSSQSKILRQLSLDRFGFFEVVHRLAGIAGGFPMRKLSISSPMLTHPSLIWVNWPETYFR